jgi:hypothetical protein
MGMVLVRHRRTKQGKDSIPGRLNDVAPVVIRGFDHQMQGGVYQRTRFFGIEFLHQLHRSLDVSKQSGHHLALLVRRSRYVLGGDVYYGC